MIFRYDVTNKAICYKPENQSEITPNITIPSLWLSEKKFNEKDNGWNITIVSDHVKNQIEVIATKTLLLLFLILNTWHQA